MIRIYPNLRMTMSILKIYLKLGKIVTMVKIYLNLRMTMSMLRTRPKLGKTVTMGLQSRAKPWMFQKNKVFLLLNPFKI